MVIAQFWAFANDLYTPEQGKRLFPLIGVGSSLGAWLGSVRAGVVMQSFGPMRLLAGGGAALILCVILARLADRRVRRSDPSARAAVKADEPLGDSQSGFAMLFADRYLMLIAVARAAAQRRQHQRRVPLRALRRAGRDHAVRRRRGEPGSRAGSTSARPTPASSATSTCSGCCCRCSSCRACSSTSASAARCSCIPWSLAPATS